MYGRRTPKHLRGAAPVQHPTLTGVIVVPNSKDIQLLSRTIASCIPQGIIDKWIVCGDVASATSNAAILAQVARLDSRLLQHVTIITDAALAQANAQFALPAISALRATSHFQGSIARCHVPSWCLVFNVGEQLVLSVAVQGETAAATRDQPPPSYMSSDHLRIRASNVARRFIFQAKGFTKRPGCTSQQQDGRNHSSSTCVAAPYETTAMSAAGVSSLIGKQFLQAIEAATAEESCVGIHVADSNTAVATTFMCPRIVHWNADLRATRHESLPCLASGMCRIDTQYCPLHHIPDVMAVFMVKNEAGNMERALRSVWPFVNSWLVVDTGSTDNTRQVVLQTVGELQREWAGQQGHVIKPGKLGCVPWQGFGATRTAVLAMGRAFASSRACWGTLGQSPRWQLFIDADDSFEGNASRRICFWQDVRAGASMDPQVSAPLQYIHRLMSRVGGAGCASTLMFKAICRSWLAPAFDAPMLQVAHRAAIYRFGCLLSNQESTAVPAWLVRANFGANTVSQRAVLFDCRYNWQYKGILHEFAVMHDSSTGVGVMPSHSFPDDFWVVARTEGCRAANPNKYIDDALALETALCDANILREDPDMYAYYLYFGARSWNDAFAEYADKCGKAETLRHFEAFHVRQLGTRALRSSATSFPLDMDWRREVYVTPSAARGMTVIEPTIDTTTAAARSVADGCSGYTVLGMPEACINIIQRQLALHAALDSERGAPDHGPMLLAPYFQQRALTLFKAHAELQSSFTQHRYMACVEGAQTCLHGLRTVDETTIVNIVHFAIIAASLHTKRREFAYVVATNQNRIPKQFKAELYVICAQSAKVAARVPPPNSMLIQSDAYSWAFEYHMGKFASSVLNYRDALNWWRQVPSYGVDIIPPEVITELTKATSVIQSVLASTS